MCFRRWGYFFQTAIEIDTDIWPSVAAYTNFVAKWADAKFPTILNVAKVDVEAWALAAEAVIGICRSVSAEVFELPLDLFVTDRLPGQLLGFDPFLANPQCLPTDTC